MPTHWAPRPPILPIQALCYRGDKYTVAWKSALPASTMEGYAKKLQLPYVTKYLKVEFHSGEAENGKCMDYSPGLG